MEEAMGEEGGGGGDDGDTVRYNKSGTATQQQQYNNDNSNRGTSGRQRVYRCRMGANKCRKYKNTIYKKYTTGCYTLINKRNYQIGNK